MNKDSQMTPSDYLANISPTAPVSSPTPGQPEKKSRPVLPIVIVGLVICVGIGVAVFGILGVLNRTTSSTSDDTSNQEPSVTENYKSLPELNYGYTALGEYSEDLIIAKEQMNGQTVILDKDYNVVGVINESDYTILNYSFHDGFIPVICIKDSNRRAGFLNKAGELAISCNYTSVEPFKDGIANVSIVVESPDGGSDSNYSVKVIEGTVDTNGSFQTSSETTVNSSMLAPT